MQKRFKGLKYTASVLSVLSIYLVNNASAQTHVVKIGFAAPLTGAQAQYGKDMQQGAQLAIEQINAQKPKLAGQDVQFELIAEDDQADPKMGTLVAQKLVDMKIVGMLGHFNSGTSIPASRVYYKAGIPQIAMATAPDYTNQKFKTTFRMMTSDTQQGNVVGTFAVKALNLKQIAVIDDRTAYGQGLADEFVKAVKKSGGKIVRHEFVNDKTVDFKSILTNIKRDQPQAIFFGGPEAQAASLAQQAKSLGITAKLMAGEMVKTDNFIKLADKSSDGFMASLAGIPLEKMPGGNAYKTAYEKRFKEPVQTYSPYAYDGAMAMIKAMLKANSSQPAKYLPILKDLNVQGVTGTTSYDAKGDLKQGGITIYQVKNGVWAPVKTIF